MARRTRKSTTRRNSGSSYGRRSGSARRASPSRSRAGSARRGTSRARGRSAPQTVRIVLETAGSNPVRAGEAVGIGQKVAPAPRTKPRF